MFSFCTEKKLTIWPRKCRCLNLSPSHTIPFWFIAARIARQRNARLQSRAIPFCRLIPGSQAPRFTPRPIQASWPEWEMCWGPEWSRRVDDMIATPTPPTVHLNPPWAPAQTQFVLLPDDVGRPIRLLPDPFTRNNFHKTKLSQERCTRGEPALEVETNCTKDFQLALQILVLLSAATAFLLQNSKKLQQ